MGRVGRQDGGRWGMWESPRLPIGLRTEREGGEALEYSISVAIA